LPSNRNIKKEVAAKKVSSLVKGAGLRILLRRHSWVQIPPPAPVEGEVESTNDYARELAIKLKEGKSLRNLFLVGLNFSPPLSLVPDVMYVVFLKVVL